MNKKIGIVLLLLGSLVSTGQIQAIWGDIREGDQVTPEHVDSVFKTFKKDLRCAFSKKGCMPEQKERLAKQGIALIALIGVAAYGYKTGFWRSEEWKKQQINEEQNKIKKLVKSIENIKDLEKNDRDWVKELQKASMTDAVQQIRNKWNELDRESKGMEQRGYLDDMKKLLNTFLFTDNS